MIREAVKGLEALGIVEARLGAGLFVQQFSFHHLFDSMVYGIQFEARQLADVLEVRHLIEMGMVPKVIAMRAPEQVERLRGILTQMHLLAERGEYQYELDEQFHRLLHANTGNAFLVKILDIFWQVYREAQRQASFPTPRDPMATYKRRENSLVALDANDVKAMTAAMMRHRVGVENRIRLMEEAQKLQAES